MPQIHELSSASTITSGNTLAMDTGTVTQKIDYNVLAKCIIEQYASSSLGGSARSVKTALDAVISKQWTGFSNTSTLTSQAEALADNSNVFGFCTSNGHQTEVEVPYNANYYVQVYKKSANYITIFLWAYSNPANHQYVRVKNNGTWGEWVKQPTRAEMDEVKARAEWGFSDATSYKFKLPNKRSNAFYSFVFYGGTSANAPFAYICFLPVDGDNATLNGTLTQLTPNTSTRTFTVTYDTATKSVTIVADTTVYGGVHLIAA